MKKIRKPQRAKKNNEAYGRNHKIWFSTISYENHMNSEREKKERLLFVLLINNDKDTLQKTMKELKEQFTTVEIATTKNTANLMIQGKTTKKVLVVWVDKEDMV